MAASYGDEWHPVIGFTRQKFTSTRRPWSTETEDYNTGYNFKWWRVTWNTRILNKNQTRWVMEMEIFEKKWRLWKAKEILREKSFANEEKLKWGVEGVKKGRQLRGQVSEEDEHRAGKVWTCTTCTMVNVRRAARGSLGAPGVDGGGQVSFRGGIIVLLSWRCCCCCLPLPSALIPRDFSTWPSQDLQSQKFYS